MRGDSWRQDIQSHGWDFEATKKGLSGSSFQELDTSWTICFHLLQQIITSKVELTSKVCLDRILIQFSKNALPDIIPATGGNISSAASFEERLWFKSWNHWSIPRLFHSRFSPQLACASFRTFETRGIHENVSKFFCGLHKLNESIGFFKMIRAVNN